MKTKLIVIKQADPQKLLKQSLEPQGLEIIYINQDRLPNTWATHNTSGLKCVAVDYPIESQVDIETVSKFIDSLSTENPVIYYAPRPNSYVSVKKPALIGAIIKVPLASPFLAALKDPVKKILHYLPAWFSKLIRTRLRITYEKMSNLVGNKKISKNSNNNHKPQIKVPSYLSLEANWSEWKNEESLTHDLLNRVHYFFPHPLSMHVAILNYCNLKCVMCPYHSPVYRDVHTSGYFDEKKSLSFDVFKKVADYAGKHRIPLQFGQIEETLLHPDIFKFIKYAKSKEVPHIHLTTNGTLLTPDKAEALAQSGIDSVMFSIDSVDPETYKKIRGSNLDRLERNIEYFIPLAKKAGIVLTTSFIRQPLAINQRDEFIQKWRKKGIDQVTFYVLTEHEKQTGEMIRTEQFREDDERYPCASPWVQTVIMPDGGVGLCCKTMADIGWKVTSVGNIHDQDFEEIWVGERYRTVRKELLMNKFEEFTTCKYCSIWSATTNLMEYGKDYVRSFNETMETITFVK